ncbi:MAG: hypothetical protein MI923_12855 [Phycisphaerales bacterium]|nr:hypothetical protein [Phycisphaerales bacterium]
MYSARAVLILAICLFATPSASLALPADQRVVLRLYENPNEPQSKVVFSITLQLKAEASDGSFIGWEIQSAGIRQYDQNGNGIGKWTESLPSINTPDGLWWTAHEDPNLPKLSEFTELPSLYGTAEPNSMIGPNLNYDLAAKAYIPPEGTAPFQVTASLDYNFTMVGEPQPEAEGEQEPAEVDDDDDDAEMTAKQRGEIKKRSDYLQIS